jgi:hypothetical protein
MARPPIPKPGTKSSFAGEICPAINDEPTTAQARSKFQCLTPDSGRDALSRAGWLPRVSTIAVCLSLLLRRSRTLLGGGALLGLLLSCSLGGGALLGLLLSCSLGGGALLGLLLLRCLWAAARCCIACSAALWF